MAAGRVVAAVGEAESGRATLLAQACRRVWPRDRILSARAPRPSDVEAWMSLWSPELGKPHTVVIVGDVDTLPAWAVERAPRPGPRREGSPARCRSSLPRASADPVRVAGAGSSTTVVAVPPLRERTGDVMPLARYAAARVRGREVAFTPAAEHALEAYGWPGNVGQLTPGRPRVGDASRRGRRATPAGRGARAARTGG